MNILIFSDDSDVTEFLRSTLTRGIENHDIKLELSSSFRNLDTREIDSFDLVIAESRLGGKLAVDSLLEAQVRCPIVILGSPEDLTVGCFDLFLLDFLTKPLKSQKLLVTLMKAQRLMPYRPKTGSEKSYKKRFLSKTGSRLILIAVEKVAYFFSEDGMTFLMETGTGQKYMIEASLNQLETDFLDPGKFYRINRSFIVNIDELIDLKPFQNGRLILSVRARTDQSLIVAREKVHEFKAWLDQ